jgi:HEPN domain-containing protein
VGKAGAAIPKTHEFEDLLDLLMPHDATLNALRRRAHSLTRFAVDYRYPGVRATTQQMQSALRSACAQSCGPGSVCRYKKMEEASP